eukprot:2551216-Amphidinium_carterae.2
MEPSESECCISVAASQSIGESCEGRLGLVTCSPLRADATKLSKNGGEKGSSQMPTYHALLTGHIASAQ